MKEGCKMQLSLLVIITIQSTVLNTDIDKIWIIYEFELNCFQ